MASRRFHHAVRGGRLAAPSHRDSSSVLMRLVRRFVTICAFGALAAPAAAQSSARSQVLWYDTPATQWVEALPVGNGRLGAMVFGGVARERIQFNEATIWTGGPL